MKTMIIIETESERAKVRTCWENLMRDRQRADVSHPRDYNAVDGAVNITTEGSVDLLFTTTNKGNEYAIVYDLLPDGWHIYNFNTMEEEIVPEGDLAGLCNTKKGNFPFFN